MLVVLVLLALATTADSARAGRRSSAVAVIGLELCFVLPALADFQISDDLLGFARVLERVTALPQLLRRRVDPGLRVRNAAAVLASGLSGGAPFGLALLAL